MAKKPSVALKILAQQRALEAGKAGYKRADVLLEEVVQRLKPGESVHLPDGSVATLIDKFATKNRIGAGLGVNRFEIEIQRAADVTSKL